MKTQVKTEQEIADMRTSGRMLAEILEVVAKATVPGVTTQSLDEIARAEIAKRITKAAFLGYQGFPATICISINDEIVHGLPGSLVVKEGDLVGLDFGITHHGMITDAAMTVPVGEVSKPAARLLKGTKIALDKAIDCLHDGVRVGDIGAAVEAELKRYDLKGIHILGGHGVGHELHEDPIVLNHGTAGTGQVLRAGMTIAIEPIASLGTHDAYLADDGWTFITKDGSLSSQFEHTVLITKDGAEILTTT